MLLPPSCACLLWIRVIQYNIMERMYFLLFSASLITSLLSKSFLSIRSSSCLLLPAPHHYFSCSPSLFFTFSFFVYPLVYCPFNIKLISCQVQFTGFCGVSYSHDDPWSSMEDLLLPLHMQKLDAHQFCIFMFNFFSISLF